MTVRRDDPYPLADIFSRAEASGHIDPERAVPLFDEIACLLIDRDDRLHRIEAQLAKEERARRDWSNVTAAEALRRSLARIRAALGAPTEPEEKP